MKDDDNAPLEPSPLIAIGGDPGALEAMFARGAAKGARGASGPAKKTSGAGVLAQVPPDTHGGQAAHIAMEACRDAYRQHGHRAAALDPLSLARPAAPSALDPARYGLAGQQYEPFIESLRQQYCGSIGWDVAAVDDDARAAWLFAQAEAAPQPPDTATAQALSALLTRAQAFESGLNARIPGGKLFGLGGAETFLVALETILAVSVAEGARDVVIGGMHRGRFAMLATVMGKPLSALVAEILGTPAVPDGLGVSSDVSYHLGYSGTRQIAGHDVTLSVSPHPSHLQLTPVIAQGRAWARQQRVLAAQTPDGESANTADSRQRARQQAQRQVLPLLLHTDASFAGQGLVAEMLQLSALPPFNVGGSIHVVINNQIGFTTPADEARSAATPTRVAAMIGAPVLRVNGDDVDAVWRAAHVAARYRAAFARDCLLEIVCYRRPGHNEIDEPRFTQPRMMAAIDARTPIAERYAAQLTQAGQPPPSAATAAAIDAALADAFAAAPSRVTNDADRFDGVWRGYRTGTAADLLAPPATGIDRAHLRALGHALTTLPDGFNAHPKVARFLRERRGSIDEGEGITWATAEALAFASLLEDGVPVRFGGQDALRGAFTQRHLTVHDQATGARHQVFDTIARGTARTLHNTPLIENAVLCFEYGVSLADPRRLTVWEAQFGEFLNVAQAVFDQAIACGEDRWLRSSGLVMMLPHGLDGGGPDHSTARPERLLAACADANIALVNASTPANLFHALRRQVHAPYRKPLALLTPKFLLRHKTCVSDLASFEPGTRFEPLLAPVLSDEALKRVERVIITTGKVAHLLAAAVTAKGLAARIAIVRVEQLHPFPTAALKRALGALMHAEAVWVEEEPANMGYHLHIASALAQACGRPVRRIGRPGVATPAVGVKAWHQAQEAQVIETALAL
ncbi:MAG: 2-oxoglutarate dehydrogenase E1 component [Pseudomonadota bacterium]